MPPSTKALLAALIALSTSGSLAETTGGEACSHDNAAMTALGSGLLSSMQGQDIGAAVDLVSILRDTPQASWRVRNGPGTDMESIPPDLLVAIHRVLAEHHGLLRNFTSSARSEHFRAFFSALHDLLGVLSESKVAAIYQPPMVIVDLTDASTNYNENAAVVIDGGGDDVYTNNAGGNLGRFPVAILVDLGGSDYYSPPPVPATNGGGVMGTGLLVDISGSDTYHGRSSASNGGGLAGSGMLLDLAGDDDYFGADAGTNGGGFQGTGALIDAGGNDTYVGGDLGSNGGAEFAGSGFLLDASGNDRYEAGHSGTNGGGHLASGSLLDFGGDDEYRAYDGATNGGSADGEGFLFDACGDDTYRAGSFGTNGGTLGGSAALVDVGGNDLYSASSSATNGGAIGGTSRLVDFSGDDAYYAVEQAVNGGAAGASPSFALLFDGAGRDTYADLEGGGGADRSQVPKGLVGAQVDMPPGPSG